MQKKTTSFKDFLLYLDGIGWTTKNSNDALYLCYPYIIDAFLVYCLCHVFLNSSGQSPDSDMYQVWLNTNCYYLNDLCTEFIRYYSLS